ncbi:hypothetical protein MM438_15750 [Arsenicicoccus dermatophilus]|nr:hypothetical protein [Arsenicicoccus dermatophilus]
MGDRYYNPTRGLFTSLDPEPGGNPNAYGYPPDPINMYDLDGHWGWGDTLGAVALGACVLASAGLCGAATLAVVAYSGYSNAMSAVRHEKSWGQAAFDFGVDAFLGKFLKPARSAYLIGRHARSSFKMAKGVRGVTRAMYRNAKGRSRYAARHRSGRRLGSALRHSGSEYHAHWRLRRRRLVWRGGLQGAAFAGNFHRSNRKSRGRSIW